MLRMRRHRFPGGRTAKATRPQDLSSSLPEVLRKGPDNAGLVDLADALSQIESSAREVLLAGMTCSSRNLTKDRGSQFYLGIESRGEFCGAIDQTGQAAGRSFVVKDIGVVEFGG
jgi:hypothetical protein